MNRGYLFALTVFCAFVLGGCFLPWVSFKTTLDFGGAAPEGMREMQRFVKDAMTISAFNGHVTLFGLTLPNWLVFGAAALTGVLAWLRAAAVWDTSPTVGIVASAYCTAHLVILLVVLVANPDKTRIGPGALLALLGSAGMLVVSILARLDAAAPRYRGPSAGVRGGMPSGRSFGGVR